MLVKEAILALQVQGIGQAEVQGKALASSMTQTKVETGGVEVAARGVHRRLDESKASAKELALELRHAAHEAHQIGTGRVGGLLKGGSGALGGLVSASPLGIALSAGALAFGAYEAYSRYSERQEKAGERAEIHNHINVPVHDGDIRRAGDEARRATELALQRRIDDLRDTLYDASAFRQSSAVDYLGR